MGKIWF